MSRAGPPCLQSNGSDRDPGVPRLRLHRPGGGRLSLLLTLLLVGLNILPVGKLEAAGAKGNGSTNQGSSGSSGSGQGDGGHEDDDGGHEDDDGGHGGSNDQDPTAHNGHGHRRDWIRLLSVADAPDPFEPRLGPLQLSSRTAVRDNAAPSGNHGPTHPRYSLRICWDIYRGQTRIASVVKEEALLPPFTYIELPLSESNGRQRFLDITSTLTWNGRTAGGVDLEPGNFTYRVIAELLKYSPGNSPQPHQVDDSEPVVGVITLVSPRVEPPSVNPVPELTREAVLPLSGTKPTDTAIILNAQQVVAVDAGTTWNTTVALQEGNNVFEIRARNASGLQSVPVIVNTFLDSVPPPPPAIEPPPPVSSSPTVHLSGTKAPGTAIYINGVEVVPANDETTWTLDLELEDGTHELVVTSVDEAGNPSIVPGAEQTEVAVSKPVIGGLSVEPQEVHAGGSTTIHYRLFAEVPPVENADLVVHVRILDGSRIVRTLLSGIIQSGSPEGTPYEVSWDLLDSLDQPAEPNRSYTVEVLADRAAPTQEPPERANANPKTTSLLVIGSRRVKTDDGSLELVFRPDDLEFDVEPRPCLTLEQSRKLQQMGMTPVHGGYALSTSKPADGSILCLFKIPSSSSAPHVRPVLWQGDEPGWRVIADVEWNASRNVLSFELPGTGILLFASPEDAQAPAVASETSEPGEVLISVKDAGAGLDLGAIRCQVGEEDVTSQVQIECVRGEKEVRIRLSGPTLAPGKLDLYLLDRRGNARHDLRRGW